tara:strand:+ start:310 stop:543 length:234 start_codon:yes stop_codon:yes gene_type:complete
MKKIIALITPLILGVLPKMLDLSDEKFEYDHKLQTGLNGAKNAMSNTLKSTTWNGTQTFDVNGNPWDNDSDSDDDPY